MLFSTRLQIKQNYHQNHKNLSGYNHIKDAFVLDKNDYTGGHDITTIDGIFPYLKYGSNLREIRLTKITKLVVKSKNVYRADKIIVGQSYCLSNESTYLM